MSYNTASAYSRQSSQLPTQGASAYGTGLYPTDLAPPTRFSTSAISTNYAISNQTQQQAAQQQQQQQQQPPEYPTGRGYSSSVSYVTGSSNPNGTLRQAVPPKPSKTLIKEAPVSKRGDTAGIVSKWQDRILCLHREEFEYFEVIIDPKTNVAKAPKLKGKVPLNDCIVAALNPTNAHEFTVLAYARLDTLTTFSRSLAATLTGAEAPKPQRQESQKRMYYFRSPSPAEAKDWVTKFNGCILGQYLRECRGLPRLKEFIEAAMPLETPVKIDAQEFATLGWLILFALRDDEGKADGFWGLQVCEIIKAGAKVGNILIPELVLQASVPSSIVAFLSTAAGLLPDFDLLGCTGPTGLSLAHFAAQVGDVHLMQYLISLGHRATHLESADCNGDTPLIMAIRAGHTEIATLLLESATVSPNAKGTDGHSPLTCALSQRPPMANVAALLLTKRADPNHRPSNQYGSSAGDPPIHLALQNGCLEIISALLVAGASVDDKNTFGSSALHEGLKSSLPDITVMEMFKASRNPNTEDAEGNTIMHLATMMNRMEICKIVCRKSNPNKKNGKGLTPLMYAVKAQNFEMIEILLSSAGLDCNIGDTDSGETVMHMMMAASSPMIPLLVVLVEQYGALLSVRDKQGATPITTLFKLPDLIPGTTVALDDANAILKTKPEMESFIDAGVSKESIAHMTARRGDVQLLALILEYQPNLAIARDGFGNTPAHAAAYFGQTLVLQLPSIAPAISCQNNNGSTPLHFAAAMSPVEAVIALLEIEDFRYNVRNFMSLWDNEGNTPLHCAIVAGRVDVLEAMVKRHVHTDVRTEKTCESPLHLAVRLENVECISVLAKNGASLASQLPDSLETPLHVAVKNGKIEEIEALLQSPYIGSFVNLRNRKGETALHHALRYHAANRDIHELLLSVGADANMPDAEGNLPGEQKK